MPLIDYTMIVYSYCYRMKPPVNDVRKKFNLPTALLFFLTTGIVHDSILNTAQARTFTLKNSATPTLSIRVGDKKKITEVAFDVNANDVGNAIPVKGKKKIKFTLILRATAANPLTGFLTVDSAIPLSNGSGGTMPTSEFSWVSKDGDIPSGTFTGTANQPLASFVSSQKVTDTHDFQYLNQNIYDAGTYTGQVTYTWAAP